jgi:chemotaxis protein MotB
LPYPTNKSGYSNWELSSDRANVARHELNMGGLMEDKVLRVVGLASSIAYNVQNPNDPMNRRISIIVMNKKTENQVLHEGANQIAPATPATPEELNVAPLPAVSPNVQQNTKITAPPTVPVVAPH